MNCIICIKKDVCKLSVSESDGCNSFINKDRVFKFSCEDCIKQTTCVYTCKIHEVFPRFKSSYLFKALAATCQYYMTGQDVLEDAKKKLKSEDK